MIKVERKYSTKTNSTGIVYSVNGRRCSSFVNSSLALLSEQEIETTLNSELSFSVESNSGCQVVFTETSVTVEAPFAGYRQHDGVLKRVAARRKPSAKRGPWGAKSTLETSVSEDGTYCFNAKKFESLRGQAFFFAIANGVVTVLGVDYTPEQGVDY